MGIFVDATRTDTDTNDIADGLTNCVTRDGQSPWTANLPAGGFKITGLANGASGQDSTTFTQVFTSPAFVTPSATTTPALGSNNLLLSTTAYVDQTAFSAALPAQSLGLLVSTGSVASFSKNLAFGLNFGRAIVASHATTADIWAALGNQIDWTGTATTTAFPAAPQAGASRTLICASTAAFTAGANMLIDGVGSGNTVTCAANDQVIVQAVTTTQFKLSRIKYDGTSQAIPAATQAEMESAASNAVTVTPLSTNWHPGVAKVWIKANGDGSSILASHNVTSITDGGVGDITVTIATDFSSANYSISMSVAATLLGIVAGTPTAGAFQLKAFAGDFTTPTDPSFYFASCFGDQA